MNDPTYRYSYGKSSSADDQATILVGSKAFCASIDRFQNLATPAGRAVPPWAQDLLTVAKAVHIADRRSRRKSTHDGWTRSIDLTVAVHKPAAWTETLVTDLHELAGLLTADRWQIHITADPDPLPLRDALWKGEQVEQVALFSGGLDSTSYAAERAHAGDRRIAFVTFSQNKIVARQRQVFQALWPGHHFRGIQQSVHGADLSSRTRGLLFMATAVSVAAAHGASTVVVPENGQLAINPPLTASRLAACSTRSVHPRTLMLINKIITGLDGKVKITNPYQGYTKGQVCGRALATGIDPRLLWNTISCGHPPINRGPAPYHCGRCFPCLVRRSALHAALNHDGTDYQLSDFWDVDRKTDSNDVYALHQWLSLPFRTRDLIADVALPDGTDIRGLWCMLTHGRSELAALFRDLVPENHLLHLDQAA